MSGGCGANDSGRVHLVGIGGGHMSAIARVLLARGVPVSGSDTARSAQTEALAALGARVQYGHSAAQVEGAALVVATAAAKAENPELVEAARRGIPVLSRAAMVARLMAGRTAVAVAGSHGKSTTSAMVTWLLREAGQDPAFLLGAEAVDLGVNAADGSGPAIVVEADEYARAFHAYTPDVAVVTNVDADHLEYYGSLAAYVEAFRVFLGRVQANGVLIACSDSPVLVGLLEAASARVERYAVRPATAPATADRENEWLALDRGPAPAGGHAFTVVRRGEPVAELALRIPGAHNVANALGALAAGAALGVEPVDGARALARFRGAKRRFEVLGEAGDITVVDDFGHHPTEIAATLAAARGRYPGRRLVAAFQPHTYSRSAYLFEEFRTCFAGADDLLILETFASRETAAAGLSARSLAEAVSTPAATYVATAAEAVALLSGHLRSGDVLLTIGAGDIDRVGHAVLQALRAP